MKTAILYIGYHYNKVDTYNKDGKIRNVNWLESYNNQQEYVFKTLKDKYNAEIDVYFTTYSSEHDEMLVKYLKPKNYLFNILDTNISSAQGRYNNIEKGLQLISSSNINYDTILFLRFDLLFVQPITSLNIDLNQFNITFLNYCGESYDDIFTFCVFNGKYFNTLKTYLLSEKYKTQALYGGHSVHINIKDFHIRTNIIPNILIKDGKYKVERGWQVNINPIYFLASQMNDVCCYLCYKKYNNNKFKYPCSCEYHQSCYNSYIHSPNDCVKCRNLKILNYFKPLEFE